MLGSTTLNFIRNQPCQEDVTLQNETDVFYCSSVPHGRYVSIQRVAPAPPGSHGNPNVAPLSLCEVEILGTKGEFSFPFYVVINNLF